MDWWFSEITRSYGFHSSADAQILENRKFSIFDICRFFGASHKVLKQVTTKREEPNIIHDRHYTLVQIESEFTTKLIARKLIGKKEIIQFDRVALYQLDPKGAASYYKDMFEIGGMTTNRIRRENNEDPVEGGDVAFVSANVGTY